MTKLMLFDDVKRINIEDFKIFRAKKIEYDKKYKVAAMIEGDFFE